MGGISSPSPAVLKKSDGASKIGRGGSTVADDLTAAEQAIADESAARTLAINAEATARGDADNALSQAIADEATARSDADNALSQAITDEATARADADTSLQNQLNAMGVSNSSVVVTGGNGLGSTNIAIRRFTTIQENIGAAITYADSATEGASFTIAENGLYAVEYVDSKTNDMYVGASRNSTQLGTAISGINAIDRLSLGSATGNYIASASCVCYLEIGDVIRPHFTPGGTPSTAAIVTFRIRKVGALS